MSTDVAVAKVATVLQQEGDRWRVEIAPRVNGSQPWDLIDQLGGISVVAFKSAPHGCAFETSSRPAKDRLLTLLGGQGYRVRRPGEL